MQTLDSITSTLGKAEPGMRRLRPASSTPRAFTESGANGSTPPRGIPRPAGVARRGRADFSAPPVPARHIPRPRLAKRLAQEREATVIVLAAPAGYGKSALLAEWAARDARPFAWLDMTADDDDGTNLLRSLSAALGSLAPGAERPSTGSVLVLDEAHRLRSRLSLEILAELAADVPPGVTLVVAFRSEPQLRLGRLRAAHRLLQIGPSELAMNADEAVQLLTAAGVDSGDALAEQLVERSEGWPACMSLAASALGAGAGDGARPSSIRGSDHAVAAYLREEIFAPLDAEERSLLRRAAVLEHLSGELCDAALDREGSAQILHELAASTMILIPQDPAHTWYRCHALVRDALLAELEACEAAELPRLHARASGWYADHGDTDRAIGHAVAAGDAERVGRLLWEDAPRLLCEGPGDLQRWLSAFAAVEIASSPQLALASAHDHLGRGDLVTARHWGHVGAEALGREAPGEGAASLEAGVLLIDAAAGVGGLDELATNAGRAYDLAPRAGPLRPLCCLLRGVAMHLAGEREDARRYLREGAHAYTSTMPAAAPLCLTQLALMDIEDDDWELAGDGTARALSWLAARDLDGQPTAALTVAVWALTMARAGRADEAKTSLTRASQMLERLADFMPWYEVETRIVLARTCIQLADVAAARALLSQASRLARRALPAPRLVAWMDDAWGEIDGVSAAALSGPGSLTMAELRVLRFLPSHLSFREIGERLHVSGNTVKSQAHAVYAKLDASSRNEAVVQAAALGLIEAPMA